VARKELEGNLELNRLEKAAVVSRLVEMLRTNDGWAGETQVQKAIYFLQGMLGVNTGWRYSLYKYGPFSFDLRDDLGGIEAEGFLSVESQRPPYGPRLVPGPRYELLQRDQNKLLDRLDEKLRFVAETLGPKGVAGLERIATALFVRTELGLEGNEAAQKLNEIKPHVTIEAAKKSLSELDAMQSKAPA
jgi:uncharacterized protein YwgA